MDKKEALEKLQLIFRDVLEEDDLVISEQSCADDIEKWDSLTHVMILQVVQDEFHVSFSVDEVVQMNNVGDMLRLVLVKCNG